MPPRRANARTQPTAPAARLKEQVMYAEFRATYPVLAQVMTIQVGHPELPRIPRPTAEPTDRRWNHGLWSRVHGSWSLNQASDAKRRPAKIDCRSVHGPSVRFVDGYVCF
ncbi:hypothetical protein MTR67_040046 [Solanum verrucosum]|uniref:Uncharacterized protein n=1 Tax=Solanum verrucosum TaxID=315347 RepID=A0AAF0UJP1_SOLVR|nr:hypothetical protein MTR67_040046 [Solanum verrucosum]